MIELENESFGATFGPNSPATFLNTALLNQPDPLGGGDCAHPAINGSDLSNSASADHPLFIRPALALRFGAISERSLPPYSMTLSAKAAAAFRPATILMPVNVYRRKYLSPGANGS